MTPWGMMGWSTLYPGYWNLGPFLFRPDIWTRMSVSYLCSRRAGLDVRGS